ncbi:metallophosphoesterase [Dyadobacter sp. CY323]|uniref:metallophosphoesterase n=1 Tax=Dyadobacter sp. CY323 TaxID=2907302 RepID=UPI001F3F091C|nr:metallophosphoesterase [Dyadobacter sp. CY323]MCE6991926.1 metallophosphoesterase family protein [Dyadobacter sp. CY323]
MIPFTKLPFKINQVYLTSDTHYGHKNICSATTSWEAENAANCRIFSSIPEMNDAIVNGINAVVRKTDLLIHCGDWSFGGKENISIFRERIVCDNVILIQGNHDHHVSPEFLEFTHDFLAFHQIGFFQVESLKFVCAHYPMAIWHQSHHDVPLFYGHVHGSYENVGKSLDVGIDNIYKLKQRYTPISLQEAYSICQKKPAFLESHHNEFTS